MNQSMLLTWRKPTAKNEQDEAVLGGLYQHGTRPQWGLATRIDARDGRTSYQFQDGELRKIADSHGHLMSEVDRARGESERLQQELAAKAGRTLARRDLRDAGKTIITLDQQVALFLDEFEDGFEEAAYTKKHRGTTKRRAKAHRDAAITEAQELLGRDEMLKLLSGMRHTEVMDRVMTMLTNTSLVTKSQLQPLTLLNPRDARYAANVLSELLYGDTEMDKAMQAWINALAKSGKSISWSLATAVPALVQPQRHMCMRRSVIAHQVRWMAPRIDMTATPSGKVYVRLLAMAARMMKELEDRELQARDYLDLYDFVWLTLRPKARKCIDEMPPTPRESLVRTTGDNDAEASDDSKAA